jgi:hypothetical protein
MRRKMKFSWRGRPLFEQPPARRSVRPLIRKATFRRGRLRSSLSQNPTEQRKPKLQFLVDAAELVGSLKLIGSETETGQHHDEKQSMPKLQPPSDGMEKFHSMQ